MYNPLHMIEELRNILSLMLVGVRTWTTMTYPVSIC